MVVYGKKCVQEGEGTKKAAAHSPEDIFWNSPYTFLSES